ncbi:aminotransferase class I/II-fold pyridoxal phosphate-dependent enzyme [Rhodospirillum rubrum]|nr:aminotransferase class I/II-fold pyridoxal phosphate-dependent enzyme [Rhodospirillum rubrum]AEO50252.1 aminotransferase [Rhodospirillum rubrum F11]QXG80417.1 aminotransferase class I/II-fold pyridoxal phosphate-dependent enzyme [Rhodospirillum rubrum]
MINPRLIALPDYPFQRLATLLAGVAPGADPLALSVGEPQHPTPALAGLELARHGDQWRRYPPAAGNERWKAAVTAWLTRRYGLPAAMIDPHAVIPASGTREALYMLGQVLTDGRGEAGERPLVVMPDPLYLPYLGAARMNGATILAVPGSEEGDFLPDIAGLPAATLERAAAVFVCSPANPQGSIVSLESWKTLVGLARRHGFVLVADECYSEIYDDQPPPGVLEACRDLGGSLKNVLVLNSLSKRSNGAGLRSGLIAGDRALIDAFLRLRAYASAGMPLPIMEASAALWDDETHVEANRALYREKIDLAAARLKGMLGFRRPPGGFFLWLDTTPWGETGEQATLRLWRDHGLKVLPGAYMTANPDAGDNPARNRLRLALVHDGPVVARALDRLVAASPH